MAEIKKINVDGVDYDIVSKELTKTTYTELKALRDNGQLSEGHLYRITDYITTTSTSQTKSAGNAFDVIVLAISTHELSHNARAIQHEGDTYFDGNDLGAWELWYDLDNDTEKYGWADATNGKGVIYRMIDDKKNDCPYDFKNILFYNTKYKECTTTDNYYYTFSYVVSGKLYDGTVEKQAKYCQSNSIGVRISNNKGSLHMNVFRNTSFGVYCQDNILGSACSSNTFNSGCQHNIFGNECFGNTLGSGFQNNILGSGCQNNIFGNDCSNNTFGVFCYNNTFGYGCTRNIFGQLCTRNNFGQNCTDNTLGQSCSSNTLGSNCTHNIFGSGCIYNYLGNYCFNVTFGNSCQYRRIYKEKTSLTFNDEYYDDGSGKLVPVKHPDLSTQPSILPYKFMGQYVYEQLVFLGEYDVENTKISTEIPCQAISVSNPLILRCDGFGYGKYIKGGSQTGSVIRKGITGMPIDLKLTFIQASSSDNIFRVEGSVSEAMANTGAEIVLGINPIKVYAHIVYTSTPEEGGYYGYNSY